MSKTKGICTLRVVATERAGRRLWTVRAKVAVLSRRRIMAVAAGVGTRVATALVAHSQARSSVWSGQMRFVPPF